MENNLIGQMAGLVSQKDAVWKHAQQGSVLVITSRCAGTGDSRRSEYGKRGECCLVGDCREEQVARAIVFATIKGADSD